MRLLRCHIENFGVLSDFDFSFEPGLNTICRGNGFGKSTLAAFIKAMLYGFPRTGARNVVDNERKRYDPWQGGSYGGFLEFEAGGISYRVTRYFGKTAAKDTFSLKDLTHRQLSGRFTEKLGEELFQLDADAFSRSTYMTQSSFRDIGVNDSLRTKLSHLVDDTNDINNYETAVKKLQAYRTQYRAYRGDGGRIGALERHCNELERDIYDAEQKRHHLLELTDSLAELNREISENEQKKDALQGKIQLAWASEARAARQNQLKSLQKAVAEEEDILRELQKKYPVGCPTLEEIRAQRENLILLRDGFASKNPAESMPMSSVQSPRLMRIFGAAGILLLLSALLCLFGGRLVAGISLAIVGLLFLLGALWLHISAVQKQLLTAERGNAAESRQADAAAQKRQAEDALERFLEKYRLPGDTLENLLNQAEEDQYSEAGAKKRLSAARQKLDAFLQENPNLRNNLCLRNNSCLQDNLCLQDNPAERETELPAAEKLQTEEKRLQREWDELVSRRSALQQKCGSLRDAVDKIPDWEDEMARVQAELREDRRRCTLADRTIELLQQAKDKLSNGYVGKIEGGFRSYADQLLAGQLGHAALDKELQLRIDEKGADRELGSFSAGTIDSLVLCMRLALIDALFEQEKPFLILDDPFVNFDDARMHRALEMLHKLAEKQQVLYLLCNSSRGDCGAGSSGWQSDGPEARLAGEDL